MSAISSATGSKGLVVRVKEKTKTAILTKPVGSVAVKHMQTRALVVDRKWIIQSVNTKSALNLRGGYQILVL